MQRARSRLKNMLRNNILKFLRPVLEDRVEKSKWKFWWVL